MHFTFASQGGPEIPQAARLRIKGLKILKPFNGLYLRRCVRTKLEKRNGLSQSSGIINNHKSASAGDHAVLLFFNAVNIVEKLCRYARKVRELKNKNYRLLGKHVFLGQFLACVSRIARNSNKQKNKVKRKAEV